MDILQGKDHFSLDPNTLYLWKSIPNAECCPRCILADRMSSDIIPVSLRYLKAKLSLREVTSTQVEFEHIHMKLQCIVTMTLTKKETYPLQKLYWKILELICYFLSMIMSRAYDYLSPKKYDKCHI